MPLRRSTLLPLFASALLLLTACSQTEARVASSSASATTSSMSNAKGSSISSRRAARESASSRPTPVHAAAPAKPPAPPTGLRIPILVYHHVRATGAYPKTTWSWKMSVSPAIFEKQMQWIAEHGYTTIDLDTYAAIVKGEIYGPQKPIVITFDDNQRSQFDLALPVLEKLGQKAVFYLITDRIGSSGTLTSDEIRLMSDKGMDMESHTITHRVLTALPQSEIDKEFIESKKTLEAILGKPVRHVAYPGTSHNTLVRERAATAGYVTATIMDPRTATETDDFFKLPRIMMTDDTNLAKTLP